MNRVSDAYSHVDDFDAKVINRTQTKQKEQEKKDQETRAKIVEDNALAKEGYDNIQSKVNNDQQPNTNFISKLNDIAKQARANAEKQAAEWADTTDGSSGAAYAGEIRSGALELARYLRDCHFTVDGEE